jgi:hypothetical protein
MAAAWSLVMVLAFATLFAAPAQAMQFKLIDTPDGRSLLVASGVIVPGDFTKLIGFVDTVPKAQRLALLVVDSPGGVVQEAGKMAVTIHNMGMPVAVAKRGLCASACVMLFAASPRRLVGYGARVGVHRASFYGGENKESHYATDSMAVHFENYGVPASIIAKVRATPPDGIAWLSDDDLLAMKATFYGPGDERQDMMAQKR